jgi:hypothetical protein
LLYLTDRLPKPAYSNDERRRREQEEMLRRRTYEGSGPGKNQIVHNSLPELTGESKTRDRKK